MISGAYSLIEINNLLIVTQNLLNCDEPLLLKLPHDADVARAFDDRMRVKLKLTQDTELLTKAVTTAFDELERDINPFNRHHLLSYLFTHYVQKGALINLDSLSTISCWHILHGCLKEIKRTQVVTPESFEGVFVGFIGQLVKIGNLEAACALHNYLQIGRKIARSKACGMGFTYTGKIMGAALLEGLKLDQRLVPDDFAQEFTLMGKLTETLLQLPLFDQPFMAQAYAQWGLSKGAFYSIQAKVLGPLGDPSAVSAVTLYPHEIVPIQSQLAVMLKSGSQKKSPEQKQVQFEAKDPATQNDVDTLAHDLSRFNLITQDDLLVRYNSKRSPSSSSTSVAVPEETLDDSQKKKKSASAVSTSKK